jgi:flagellum-specific peptidoglycan hydrolase FlgJ
MLMLALALFAPSAATAQADDPAPVAPPSGVVSFDVEDPHDFHLDATFRMLALSWHSLSEDAQLLVRANTGGEWGDWRDFGPDGEFELEDGRTSTDATWFGLSDAVEVAASGDVNGLRLTLISPEVSDTSNTPVLPGAPIQAAGYTSFLDQPNIVTRSAWGAARNPNGDYNRVNPTIRAAAVHHTAGGNAYSEAESKSVIQGTQAYHISLGWGDIGYNFLVDRFGTIYEGHAGGIDLPVHGAHTAEFNVDTFGVSYMGNTETVGITAAGLEAIAQVLAWKLGNFYIDPLATIPLWITDPDVIADFDKPVSSLPAIFGHRDVHYTACPGADLYSKFTQLRSRVAEIISSATPSPLKAKWQEVGGADSGLGPVYRAEQPIGNGRWTQFAFGAIFWSPATGAHVVTTDILESYLAQGGPTGALGFPVNDERANQVTFSGGTLTRVISAHSVGVASTTQLAPAMTVEKPGSSDMSKFIQSLVGVAQQSELVYGVPTSVTLAQAILESGWGKSDLARWGQSLFGIKCKTEASPLQSGCYNKDSGEYLDGQYVVQNSNFRAYDSLSASVMDHGFFLKDSSRYAAAFETTSADAFARAIHAAGYATAPDYADRLIQIMVQYNLYRYDLTSPTPTTVVGGISLGSVDGTVGSYYLWYVLNSNFDARELGFPIGPEADGPVNGTRIQSFDRGVVLWSARYKGHAVTGELWDKYRSDASLRTALGAVVDDASAGTCSWTQEFAGGVLSLALSGSNPGSLYRFYNSQTGAHFYTADEDEKQRILSKYKQFRLEGTAGFVICGVASGGPGAGQAVIYRFYMPSMGVHFYTADTDERDYIKANWSNVYTYEGPSYTAWGGATEGAVPFYRFYNVRTGVHFFTADPDEMENVKANLSDIYLYEDIAYYIKP